MPVLRRFQCHHESPAHAVSEFAQAQQQTALATVINIGVKAGCGLSRHQRGYGSKWTVIRARILKRDKGLCQLCLRVGVVREAKTVDHIIPKAHGGTDADSNLQSLCWHCHKAKTARERIR